MINNGTVLNDLFTNLLPKMSKTQQLLVLDPPVELKFKGLTLTSVSEIGSTYQRIIRFRLSAWIFSVQCQCFWILLITKSTSTCKIHELIQWTKNDWRDPIVWCLVTIASLCTSPGVLYGLKRVQEAGTHDQTLLDVASAFSSLTMIFYQLDYIKLCAQQ